MMKRWLILALVLQPALLGACSTDKRSGEISNTKYGVRTESTDELERLPGSSAGTSRAEVLATYFPGKKVRHLSATDFLEASDRAFAKLDHDSVIILCTEAIRLAPSSPAAYFKRGRARIDSTSNLDPQKTQADLEKAIALKYSDPKKAYQLLAIVYDSGSQKDKAIACINKAIEINPADSGLHKMKAALHAAYGDKKNARKDYDAWIRVTPNHPLPYVLRGQLLESMKEYDAALEDYKKVCMLPEVANSVSNRDMAFKLRASLLSKLDRHRDAINVINEALQKNRNEDEMLRLRGDEYMFLKEFDRAIADYSRSISIAPEFADKALDARGRAYAAIGDKARSSKDFQKARELLEKPAEKPVY